MNKEVEIALIDADSLCYFSSKDTLEESIKQIDLYINNILDAIKLKKFILFISEGKYFRHDIYPLYKSNRTETKLLFIKELKQYLKDQYQAYSFNGVEADDLIAYYSFKLKNSIICAIDKDLLKQIPGRHYNYHYKTLDFVETTEDEANKFLWLQAIMGDSTDSIPGIKGLGIGKVNKLLEGVNTNEELQLRAFKAYLDYYKSNMIALHMMQLNFKLVYLLKTEEDFKLYFNNLPEISNICSL